MANVFTISITAIDNATAVVGRVNKAIASVTAPIAKIQASTNALSREMGIGRLAKSISEVGKAAAKVGGELGKLGAPIAAFVSLGSVAAIGAMAEEWGRLGSEIGRTAATLGLSTGQLQGLRGAAQAAGVSAESMTGGLKRLGDTMEDALYGRNQDALAMMQRLGLQIRRTSDGAIDTAGSFRDLADAISHIKSPQVQALVARTFGLEDLLPLLRQGSKGIEAYERRFVHFRGVMGPNAIAAADRFRQSMVDLGWAIQGTRNAIGDKLIPIVQPLVDGLAEWIAANRELIAVDVAGFARGIGSRSTGSCPWSAMRPTRSGAHFAGRPARGHGRPPRRQDRTPRRDRGRRLRPSRAKAT